MRGSSCSSATALHPEADVSLDRSRRLRAPAGGAVAGARAPAAAHGRLPFRFGLTLVPQSLQFPILRLLRKKSVMHYLGSDIRGKTPEQLAYGKKAGRRDRRQLRRDPLGARGRGDPAGYRSLALHPGAAVRPVATAHHPRALFASPQGHRARDRGRRRARCRSRDRRGPPPRRGVRALPQRGHRRRPAQRRLVRPLRDRVHGARQAGGHLSARRCGPA